MKNTDYKILKVGAFLFVSFCIIIFVIFNSLNNKVEPIYDSLEPSFATPTAEKVTNTKIDPLKEPTPEPTPTPTIPSFGGKFIAELSRDISVNPSEISVSSYQETSFGDTSLDCPEPGMIYAQVITPGWIIVFEVNQKKYEFHSDAVGENFINCTKVNSLNTENLVKKYNLTSSKSITVNRLKGSSFMELALISDGEEKELFIQTIDRNVLIQEKYDCIYLYKIIFYFKDESTLELSSVCSDGSAIGMISSDNFIGPKYYSLPETLLNELGRLTSVIPMPGKPELK